MSTRATVPGPVDATFESTVHRLRGDPVSFVSSLVRTYGDIVRLPFGSRDLYLVNKPEFIREMLMAGPERFGKRPTPEAEAAYLQRISAFVPMFDPSMTRGYAPMMVEAAARTDERWQEMDREPGAPTVDMYREMMRITLDLAVGTLFKADASVKSGDLVDAIRALDVGYGFDPIAATLGEMMPPEEQATTPEGAAARDRILAFLRRLVEEQVEGPSDTGSLLPMLTGMMSVEQATEMAMTIMFAMHEVATTTLPWTWHLLSHNPAVEECLHEELDSMLAGRTPSYDDLPGLPYTHMVLDEARRLYPCVWIVGRFARDNVVFDGYDVLAGSVVMASQRITHHDPRYFPDPERFDPERWTPEARAARPEISFFPFSEGLRQCIGWDFSEAQDALVLSSLAQRWRARTAPGQKLEPVPQKSFTPRYGVTMTLHRR